MNELIRNYAETLYEAALFDSAALLQEELRELAAAHASLAMLPLTGQDLQRRVDILNRHGERCLVAKFESYERAYNESAESPTEQDLNFILQECRDVRTVQVSHSVKKLNDLIGASRGVAAPMPTIAFLEACSAPAMDRIVSRVKQWKARIKLKPASRPEVQPQRQKDAKFPVLSVSEFKTDLANFSKTANRSSPLSLLFMDVDKFKAINDHLGGGHAGGDRILMALSELLLRVVQPKGNVYRWGGDEFCVLLENHSLDEAEGIARRICREVRETALDMLPDGFTTSIGIASCPGSTESSSELFDLADRAMYESKEKGGGCVSRSETQPGLASADSGKARPSKEDIKRKLTVFLRQGKTIQASISFNNTVALQEKAAWEKQVEDFLKANLDDSYAVQFQIPSHETTDHPQGIMLGMLPEWRELTNRMWMLSDFISKLRG